MLFELLKELYIYEDDMNTIEAVADTFQKWCIANKYFEFEYEILDYRKKFHTNDIIIIHNMWKENYEIYTIANGNSFINDIECILDDYCRTTEDYNYCYDFWIDKLNGILNE